MDMTRGGQRRRIDLGNEVRATGAQFGEFIRYLAVFMAHARALIQHGVSFLLGQIRDPDD